METTRRKVEGPSREEQTRADILAATKRLMRKYGLRKLTMDDIASALGKKKSFLYYYYPGRAEVIRAVIESEFAEIQRQVRQTVSVQDGAAAKLRAFLAARIDTSIAIAESYGPAAVSSALQGAETGTDFASLLELRQSFDREEERFLAGLLRQGIKDGTFRPLPDKVIDDMVFFLLSAVRGVELELSISHQKPPSSARIATMLDIFLRGLSV